MYLSAAEQPKSTVELASMAFNHEAKLMVLMCLDGQHNPLSRHSLNKELMDFDPDETVWSPTWTAWGQFCDLSLIPAGVVNRRPVMSRQANTAGYALTEHGQEFAVPAAGLLLDWSLRHGGLSVQDLLGNTNTSGELRAGQTRIRVLQEACTNPAASDLSVRASFANGVNTAWDSPEYKKERTRISRNVAALALAGVINSETIEHNDDRALLINDTRPPEGLSLRPDFKVAIAIYDVIADADKVRTEKNAPLLLELDDTVIKTIAKLSERGIEADPVKVRRAVRAAYFSSVEYLGITKADPARFNNGKLTRFTVNEEHREAVEEFLNILLTLESHEVLALERGLRLARATRASSEQRMQLMNKAFIFSPYAQKKSTLQTAAEVETLISRVGNVTLDELTQAYRSSYGRPIKKEGLRNILVLLENGGRVAVTLAGNINKPGYLLKRNVYSPVSSA